MPSIKFLSDDRYISSLLLNIIQVSFFTFCQSHHILQTNAHSVLHFFCRIFCWWVTIHHFRL